LPKQVFRPLASPLWREIAERYKNTNPERVFFELRNEPHDIKAEEWRAQAEELIKTIRQIAPDHTLIVTPIN